MGRGRGIRRRNLTGVQQHVLELRHLQHEGLRVGVDQPQRHPHWDLELPANAGLQDQRGGDPAPLIAYGDHLIVQMRPLSGFTTRG